MASQNLADQFRFTENSTGGVEFHRILPVGGKFIETHLQDRCHVLQVAAAGSGALVVHDKVFQPSVLYLGHLGVLSPHVEHDEMSHSGLEDGPCHMSADLRDDSRTL